ncbi:MAG: efflux RND transporter periplasmic adaptor subunit [Gammaproteobacteria bacterium]|jgi:RND family efflux transporter MFP subunit
MSLILLAAWSAVHAQPAPAPVVVEPVVIASAMDQLSLTGTATARRTSSISPYSEGLVVEMRVDVGDVVSTGDVLARLDGVIARHELAESAAALEEARAELRDAIRRRDEAARVHADNLIAASTYESAVAEADIRKAAVTRMEAEHARQKEIVRRYDVGAPFAGVIASKFAEVGQWVQRGEALFELVDAAVLRVDVPVPQVYFPSVRAGTPATVRFDGLAAEPIDAVIKTRVPVSDPAARTFIARLEIDNSAGEFTPGMSVRVTLRPGDEQWGAALHVPRDALMRLPDGSYQLWLVTGSGEQTTARATTVQVRRFSGTFAVIEPGEGAGRVEVGDRAIVRGNESLRPGQAINIVEPGL